MTSAKPRTAARRLCRAAGPAFAAVVVVILTACAQPANQVAISIAVDPETATLTVAQSRTFTAIVTGASDTAVDWSASVGTVVGSGTTVAYVAPAAPGTAILTATSRADPGRSARATVTIVPADPDEVDVRLDPTDATLAPGQSQAFAATVTGAPDTAVEWSATCGTIVGDGPEIDYQAPATTGTCLLTATSVADPDRSATATIHVAVIGVAIDPPGTEAFTLQSRRFIASVVGTPDTDVDWSLTSGCGSLSPEGVAATVTAPATVPTQRCTLTATSVTDPDARASVALTIHPRPRAALAADPADAHPGEPVTLVWDLTNPSRTLELTCELDVLGDGASAPITAPDCGRRGSQSRPTHPYPERGAFTPTLTVRQGDDVLALVTAGVDVAIRFVQVSGGEFHAVALDRAGDVWGWGSGGYTGNGTWDAHSVPVPVCIVGSGPTCAQLNLGARGQVSAGRDHSLALDGLGRVWAWGYPGGGRLGNGYQDGDPPFELTPVPVCARGRASTCEQLELGAGGRIAGGFDHSVVVDGDGNVWAWGDDNQGQLGNGATSMIGFQANPVPVCVRGSGADCEQLNVGADGQVSAAARRTLAVDGEGRVWAWGANDSGHLGDGTTVNPRLHPVPVCAPGSGPDCGQLNLGIGGQVSAGGDVFAASQHAVAIDAEGRAWAWGGNGHGQLGDGTSTDRPTPVPVCASGSGPSCVQLILGAGGAVAAAAMHVVAVDERGRAWAWGSNSLGQLGDGTSVVSRADPGAVCAVGSGPGCAQLDLGPQAWVATGWAQSYAVGAVGDAWGWGRNANAQLGDGTTVDVRRNPVRIAQP